VRHFSYNQGHYLKQIGFGEGMRNSACPICRTEAKRALSLRSSCEIFNCTSCGVHFAAFTKQSEPWTTTECDHFRGLDLERYERSVRATRESSYCNLISRVKAHVMTGNWLDVGCSYGWLLDRARKSGFHPFGVEPSPRARMAARKKGIQVAAGNYPEVTGDGAPYSVISLMDVLEHMPGPTDVLSRTKSLLDPNGIVVLQVPDQACLLYAIANWLHRCSLGRMDFALRRLWLVELDFPHLFYMNKRSIVYLLGKCGYEIIEWYRAPIGDAQSAKDRVSYLTGESSKAISLVAVITGAINAADALSGHGGLLTAIARPAEYFRPGSR